MRRALIPILVTAALLGGVALSACGGYGDQPAPAPAAPAEQTRNAKVEIELRVHAPEARGQGRAQGHLDQQRLGAAHGDCDQGR